MLYQIEWFACPEGPISVLHDIRYIDFNQLSCGGHTGH